jgi:hypothetical protein
MRVRWCVTRVCVGAGQGAHTLGRAWKTRSGLGADKTKFTDGSKVARGDGKEGIGAKGGSSWTEKWLKFDNSYFTTMKDEVRSLLLPPRSTPARRTEARTQFCSGLLTAQCVVPRA